MKKSTLVLTALALSLGMALSPVSVFAAETAATNQQLPSLAPMLEKVVSSVVSISVESSKPVTSLQAPDQLKQFFGQNSPLCQDASPFQASPLCQGGDEGSDDGGVATKAARRPRKNSRRWEPGSLSMPIRAMW